METVNDDKITERQSHDGLGLEEASISKLEMRSTEMRRPGARVGVGDGTVMSKIAKRGFFR